MWRVEMSVSSAICSTVAAPSAIEGTTQRMRARLGAWGTSPEVMSRVRRGMIGRTVPPLRSEAQALVALGRRGSRARGALPAPAEEPEHLAAQAVAREVAEHAVAEAEREQREHPVLVVVVAEDDRDELAQRREPEERRLELTPPLRQRREQDHERVVIVRELRQEDDEDLAEALRDPQRLDAPHDEDEREQAERDHAVTDRAVLVVGVVR